MLILILAAYIGAIIMGLATKKHNDEFGKFLNENANKLLNGDECVFQGTVYTKETKLVRYRYCVSIIIMTFTRTTYYVPAESANAISILAFLITFFTGWWGLPWGPIKTIESFIKMCAKKMQ